MKFSRIFLVLAAAFSLAGCHKNDDTNSSADIQESAQMVGDSMASVDESSGKTNGSISYEKYIQRTFDQNAPGQAGPALIAKALFLPEAKATSCFLTGYGSCSSGVITRTYGGCTVGTATFTGTTTLTWSNGATCAMGAAGESIVRVPNITVTGRRGATLTIDKSGSVGQKVKWISGTGPTRVLEFSDDGIHRVFTAGSSTLFDLTSSTPTAITVTGTDRTSRVMNGGSIRIANNLTGVACEYVPTNVTWNTAACNCPTQGSWAGSCSDGKSTTLDITGCGTGTYTEGSTTTSVSFDRCSGT